MGNVAKGEMSIIEPPSVDDKIIDTTVDDPMAPKLFIKYRKEEYFPQYIVAMK